MSEFYARESWRLGLGRRAALRPPRARLAFARERRLSAAVFEALVQLTGVLEPFKLARQIDHLNGLARACDRSTVSRLRVALDAVMGGSDDLAALSGNDRDFHDPSPSRC
jgi:hypothetical protein